MSTNAKQLDEERGGRAACSACGSEPRRDDARYCATCGRALGQDYFPTESLRASYRFGRPRDAREEEATAPAQRPPKPWARPSMSAARPATARRARGASPLESPGTNGAATTALAFATYALVPYIGILFCPGALLAGGFGLLRSYRTPRAGGRRTSALGLALGLLILCAQLLLWWILYKVPEWSRPSSF